VPPPLPEPRFGGSRERRALPRRLKHSREGDVPSARTNAEAPDALPFRSAAELAATEGTAVRWALRPWLAFASTTEVDGRPKAAGKTTFVLEMAAAFLRRRPFLGETAEPCAVVMLSEQPAASLREALARAGLAECEDLHILLWAESRGAAWPAVVAAAVDECGGSGRAC